MPPSQKKKRSAGRPARKIGKMVLSRQPTPMSPQPKRRPAGRLAR
jgi:hypothetical protein